MDYDGYMHEKPEYHGGYHGSGPGSHQDCGYDGGCGRPPPMMKERREMEQVLSKLFMRIAIYEPEDMEEFSFLPISLLRSIKTLYNEVKTGYEPKICQPWRTAFWNTTLDETLLVTLFLFILQILQLCFEYNIFLYISNFITIIN